MTANVDRRLLNFLELVVRQKIENFEVQFHDGNEKGEGFLGEMVFLSLINKKTNEEINLVIKQASPSGTEKVRKSIRSTYFNEILYFTKIFPTLIDFQKSYPRIRKFDNFPECYATSLESGFERLALENLRFKKYEVHPKAKPFDTKSFKKIFRVYAELHALGFAFKHHHPQKFLEVTKDLANNWIVLNENEEFLTNYMKFVFAKVIEKLKGEDRKIIEKFGKYLNFDSGFYHEKVSYGGSYGTILHGDCWSNNFMIKYDSFRDIEHVKLIDFQIGMVATPVIDLSYSFYAGAGKESLDNFDYLLKFYHDVLSKTLNKYGCDADKVYPYEILKKEWKEYCQIGFMSGLMTWMTKLATDMSNVKTFGEIMDDPLNTSKTDGIGIKYSEDIFEKVSVDIVKHLYERDFL